MPDPTPLAPVQREIDGHTYTLSPLPMFAGLEAWHMLVKMVGPAAIAGALAVKEGGEPSGLGAALSATLGGSSTPEFVALTKKLLAGCRVTINGQSAELLSVADVHLQGKILTYFKILGFALEVHFADFFGALRAVSGRLGAKLKAALDESPSSPKPPSSIGPPGAS
jgi:hypothetical protein